jgi:hypothetical protein
MSELREAAKEVAALVSPHIVGAKKVPVRVITLRRLSSSVPTLLDDLAAAQGEVEALRAAISWLMPPFVDSKTPTEELRTRVKVMLDDVARLDARSALASEPKNSDVQQVKP